jgi:hypothetical protein
VRLLKVQLEKDTHYALSGNLSCNRFIHLYWSRSSQQESIDQLVEDNKLGAAANNQEKYSKVLGEVWL